jgi:hypothetical protein
METPDVPGALRALDPATTEGQLRLDQASYYLSKIELQRGKAPTMAPWRKRLFIAPPTSPPTQPNTSADHVPARSSSRYRARVRARRTPPVFKIGVAHACLGWGRRAPTISSGRWWGRRSGGRRSAPVTSLPRSGGSRRRHPRGIGPVCASVRRVCGEWHSPCVGRSLSVHRSRFLLVSGSPPASTQRPVCRCSCSLQIRGDGL